MLESKIQASILKYLKNEGFFTVKTIVNNKAGVPDIYALKDGINVWIEVKRPGGRVSQIQSYIHSQIREKGGIIFVVDTLDDLKEKLKELYDK